MFNFGVSLYERPKAYKLWPTDGTFTALVDADLCPYIVGYTTEEEKYAKALLRVEEGEYDRIEETPECEDAIDQLDWTINHWIKSAGADSALLYVTDSPGNFRIKVAFTKAYKGQRPSDKPPFFYELKSHLIENHNAIVATDCEADDLIVTELSTRHRELVDQGAELGSPEHKRFSDVVSISTDKDLAICPGWHYNPQLYTMTWVDVLGWLDPVYKIKEVNDYQYRVLCRFHDTDYEACKSYSGETPCEPQVFIRGKRKGEEKTKRVCLGKTKSQTIYKLKGAGLKFFYAQLLMGDDADNYPGVPGVGMTRTYEVLNTCNTEDELHNAVLEEYRKVYGERSLVTNYRGGSLCLTPEQLMAEQGRLAYLRTKAGEVWNPSVSLPSGEDERWRR